VSAPAERIAHAAAVAAAAAAAAAAARANSDLRTQRFNLVRRCRLILSKSSWNRLELRA
jgi:hypothetical protein